MTIVTYNGNSYIVEHIVEHIGEEYLFSVCYQIINRFFKCINHLGLSYCFCPEIYKIFIFCTVTHEVTQHVMFAVYINICLISLIVMDFYQVNVRTVMCRVSVWQC
jgi:hypothetical protein